MKNKATPRQQLIQHITSINKHLTKEFLEILENKVLINEAHPAYRDDHAKALGIELKAPKVLKVTFD
jgi:hypothetical protein